MKFASLVLCFLHLEQCLSSVSLSGGPNCDDGSNTVQHAIPGTTISVACAVDNPDGFSNVLIWTIPNFDVSITNTDGENATDTDQPDFVSTVTSSNNSEGTTTATLSFPAKSDLDGAVVNCRGVSTLTIDSCTLSIVSTPPTAPINLNCTNVTTNSITLVWDAPADNGGDPSVQYEVTRTPGDTAIVTTHTSIMETGLVFSTDYTFSVRANNSVGYSDGTSFTCSTRGEVFDPLPAGDIQVCLGSNETVDGYLLINITSQDCPPISPNPATTPDFDNFTITVSDITSVSTPRCQYVLPISEEKGYDITVTINNIVGSSEPNTTQFDARWIRDIEPDLENSEISYSLPSCTILNGDPLVVLNITNATGDVYSEEQPYDTELTSFNITSSLSPTLTYSYNLVVTLSSSTIASYSGLLTSSTSAMPTPDPTTRLIEPTNSTSPTGDDSPSGDPTGDTIGGGFPTVPVVAGVVGGIIAVLVVIVLVVVMIYCYKKCKEGKSERDKNDPIPLVQRSIPETGQMGVYQDPSTIEHQKAPTGDMYAVPDKGGKRRPPPTEPELATYQDPNTIKREQAPTGDLYSLPEKKPVYTQINKDLKNSGGNYADLDLVTGPRSPSGQPLISPTTRAPSHKPVVYTDMAQFRSH